ncbi:Fe-S cluster assembly ATPase SufC [Thermoanaerobacterium thermosaccharolyticum]|jgi:FeS assembly ATPase SufC|uniref:FeS assembly ATPase SufC n=1 Tax=Thermoanaerobacterium thermosaccharolyticum M0795 TaxID=698948 RepID=L0IMY8_THETR|nr:Fe-S cluster assembly ATPase SufC [Thermoanaerobacterium thermosaccharolyticum]MDI3478371.1 Fe-S cluster assembly ATP-binding protein [Thermoanaerobacterium sp.]AGB20243.1 FeS assembly ATPase SufC [Thermoanaerobacterium thermosaccharolyticum M0795]KAA5805894.1 Fe-S cluster assembly ATPase SufC [Thermoanaerobacterium thermosaccharolyticum]MBE0069107.1 Fe-S cluster assembly ATPase SufC [Thermoanaerobacterium thermosaccharolyticum]MBE0228930.1 Fe-S cluster assembly ATPase SufC [Thermoanaerobac
MKDTLLEIKNVKAEVDGKEILKGLNLTIKKGEIHAIMGPNGSGKSTLCNVIMGNPHYKVTNGEILFEGEDIVKLKVNERAKKGIFLSFQSPEEIPGITVDNFIRTSLSAVTNKNMPMLQFAKSMKEKMDMLDMKPEYRTRYLNVGFSGGEKKKSEILQMAMLNPKLVMLDEIDSGLDIDALRVVAETVRKLKTDDMSILIITHYNRILDYLEPDVISVLANGRIVKEGDKNLAKELEKTGYESILDEVLS